MKVLFLAIGDETIASARARVYGYLPFLIKKGIRYKVLSFTSKFKQRRILNLKRDNFLQYFFETFYRIYIIARLFILAKIYDVIFLQKVILPRAIWNTLKIFNKEIIFDFDDAIYLYKDITYLLKDAKCVIVSNKYLKEFASRYNEKVYELISPVKVNNSFTPRKNDSVMLGWTGSPETSRSLHSLIPVFKDLKKRFDNLNIEFMGSGKNNRFESLNVKINEWSIEGEKRYLGDIDIGIMPLKDDEWSRSKAGYKILLYLSMGVACVASPVGINNEIIKDGINGYLANAPREWLKKLSSLIEDYPLRQKLAEEGWKTTEKFYSYRVCAPKLLDILTNSQNKKKGWD